MTNRFTKWLAAVLRSRCEKIIAARAPDIVIGRSGNGAYLRRWYCVPRNPILNVYLHLFFRSDPETPHDHPWISLSLSLSKKLFEVAPTRPGIRTIESGDVIVRGARFAHRLLVPERGAMTLFITGPRIRNWGFLCPGGWRLHSEFTKPVGGGCE